MSYSTWKVEFVSNILSMILVIHHDEDCKGSHDDDNDNYNTPNIVVEKATISRPSYTDKKYQVYS